MYVGEVAYRQGIDIILCLYVGEVTYREDIDIILGEVTYRQDIDIKLCRCMLVRLHTDNI